MFKNMIDISPIISAHTAVYPGDIPFERNMTMDFEHNHLEVSSITTSLHIGAHTDAPCHYADGASDIATRELEYYLGDCQVITVNLKANEKINSSHFSQEINCKRVLFRTDSFPDPNFYNDDFNTLSEDLIEQLHKQAVILVGIDTPSIDPAHCKKMSAHKAVHKHNMAILEGIILKDVDDGIYNLIALPLKIKGADASPVRAILIKE